MASDLLETLPWLAALAVSLGFRKLLFKSWPDFFECLGSWLRSVAMWLPFRGLLQIHAEARDSAENLRLALLGAAGLITGLITRALMVGAELT